MSQNFDKLLNKYGGEVPLEDMVEQLMTDTVRADEEKLPNTGCSPEWELILSSIFIGTDTPSVRNLESLLLSLPKSFRLHLDVPSIATSCIKWLAIIDFSLKELYLNSVMLHGGIK